MITTYAVSLSAVDCTSTQRDAVTDIVDEWLVKHFPFDNRGPGVSVRSRADAVYRVTVTIAPEHSTHVETITATVRLDAGTLVFDLRSLSMPKTTRIVPVGGTQMPPERLVKLVQSVLAAMPAEDANYRVSHQPHLVTTAEAAQELSAFIDAPGRRLPVVTEIIHADWKMRPVSGIGAPDLAGLAHVFHVIGDAAATEFARSTGMPLVSAGTITAHWPGKFEPLVVRLQQVQPQHVRREWETIVGRIAESAARSVASLRVPPPPRDDAGIIDDEVREARSETSADDDADLAIYVEQLQSQVDDLEASLADADRIIAAQRADMEKQSSTVDELILKNVTLEMQRGKDASVLAVPSMKEALRLAREHCPFLVFHERAIESGESLEGPEPVSVLQDLVRLNEVARAWMSGEITGNSIKLACRQMGLDFAPDISDNARQKYEEDYVIMWHGKPVIAAAHLRRGRKTHLVRIHVHFDDERQQVVVAYIGRHLRDKGSSS